MRDTALRPNTLAAGLLNAAEAILQIDCGSQYWQAYLRGLLDGSSTVEKQQWGLSGEVSVGKSTLLNVLVGRPVLPEGNQGTTSVPTWVVAPNGSEPDGTAVLEPRSRDGIGALLGWLVKDRLRQSASDQSASDAARRWLKSGEAKQQSALAELTEQVLRSLERKPVDWTKPIRTELGGLSELHPLDPVVWQRAVVHIESVWGELGVDWIDLPGLGHANPAQLWMTEQALTAVDRTFLLLEPRGATELTLGLLAGFGADHLARVSLVFTRIDEIAAHGEDWREASERVMGQIGWKGDWAAVSAACARAARDAMQLRPGQRQLRALERVALQHEPLSPRANLDLSGVPALEESLRGEAIDRAWTPVRRLAADLREAVSGFEALLEERSQKRITEASERLHQSGDSLRQRLFAARREALTSLREALRTVVLDERAAFRDLDRDLLQAETRQRNWLRMLAWNIKSKVALAKLLQGLQDRFGGALKVLANAAFVPHGPHSACSEEHARELVNLGRLGDLLDPFDELHGRSFFHRREDRLHELSGFRRWAASIGFATHLRAEALGYVAELSRSKALAERDQFKATYADSGLARWRSPLRSALARQRRKRQVAVARFADQDVVEVVSQLVATSAAGSSKLEDRAKACMASLDADADRQLRDRLIQLRTYLDLVDAQIPEDCR